MKDDDGVMLADEVVRATLAVSSEVAIRKNVSIETLMSIDIRTPKARDRQPWQPPNMHSTRRQTSTGADGVVVGKVNMR